MKTVTFKQAAWEYENREPSEGDGDLEEWLSEQDEDVLLAIREDREDLRRQIDAELCSRDEEQ